MSRSLSGRLRRWLGRRPKSLARPRAASRPTFDHLEDRIIPAVRVWSGASGLSANWSDAANWAGGAAPLPGDNLVFPGGAARVGTANNDFLGPGAVFNSLTLDAAGYTLGGNDLQLGAGGLTVNSAAGSGTDTINLNVTLGANAAITNTYSGPTLQLAGAVHTGGFTLTFGGSGAITEATDVSDSGGVVKTGTGTLLVESASYGGPTTINAGIVQLAGGATLGGGAVTVNSGATLQLLGGVTFGQALTLNGGGVGGGIVGSTGGALEISGTDTVSGGITLGSDAVIGVDPGQALTVNTNPVALAGHTLTVNSGGSATFGSALNGGAANAGGLVVNGALTTGTVALGAANTYFGATTVGGGTLTLTGGGTLASIGPNAVTVAQGATLLLDDSAGTNGGRIPASATTNLNGGTLRFVGGASPNSETLGAIALTGGHSTIQVTPNAGMVVTAARLVRSTGATVNFNSSGTLGSASDKVLFTNAPATVTTSGGARAMLYATVGDSDFAKYTNTGVAAFAAGDYKATLASAGSTDVVKLTGNTTVAANTTIGGLLTAGNKVTINLGITLSLGGGGLLMRNATIVPGGGGLATLNFGSEGFLFANAVSGSNTITTQITGTRGVDFSGPASAAAGLLLNPGALGSAYSGGSYLNSTNLSLQGSNPLGAATNPLTLVGGVLTTAAPNYRLSNAIRLAGATTTLNATNLTASGQVTLTGTSVLTVAQPLTVTGKLTGSGSLVEVGTGALTLSPVLRSDYTGGTVLAGGTLILGSAVAPVGAGPLTLAGGPGSSSTLQSSVAGGITLANPVTLDNAAPAAGANVTISGPSPFTFTGLGTLTGQTVLQVNTPTTFTGVIGGSGGLTQSGTSSLTLTGNNTYGGATMLTAGSLTIDGAQPNSAVGVVGGALSGGGTTGFVAVGPGGSDTAGPLGNGNGIQASPGANFSEGGNLVVQVSAFTTPGTDYSRLNLGAGALVVGGSNAAPATLSVDLSGLTATGQANGVILFGGALGTSPVFNELRILNNPNDYAVSVTYTGNGVTLIVTPGMDNPVSGGVPTGGVPSTTSIWTGQSGGDPNWSDANNWLGDVAPQAGNDLIFPAGSAQFLTTNDYASNTQFNNITVEAGGYSLAGNAVILTGNLVTTEPPAPGTPTTTVSLPLNVQGLSSTIIDTYAGTQLLLTSTLTSNGSVTFDGNGTITVTGKITGGGGTALTKNGPGTLNLFPAVASGNDYTGETLLNDGLTVINNNNSLGRSGASDDAKINSGATLQTRGNLSIAEPLNINGQGVGGPMPGTFLGALDVTGLTTLSGGINLFATKGNTTIDNDQPGVLTVQGTQIQLEGNTLTWNNRGKVALNASIVDGAAFTKGGSVVFNGNGTNGSFTLTTSSTYSGKTFINSGIVTLNSGGDLTATSDVVLGTNPYPQFFTTYPSPVTVYPGIAPGVLVLDDSGATNSTDRINDSANLVLTGGELTFVGAPNTDTKEVVGTIHVAQGQSFIQMVPGTGKKATLALSATSITDDAGATVDFIDSSNELGSSSDTIKFTNAPGTTGNNGGILPWATFSPATAAGTLPVSDYATYDSSSNGNGLKQFTGYVTDISTAGSKDILKLDGVSQTLTQNLTVAALLLRNGATLTINPGVTLALTGGLLTSGIGNLGQTPNILAGSGGGADPVLAFGTQAYGMFYSPTFIGTPVAGTGSLALGGDSTLDLAPSGGGSTFSGSFYLDSGTLSLDNNNKPLGAGGLNLYGGVLTFGGSVGPAVTLANPIGLNGSVTDIVPPGGAFGLTLSGPVVLDGYDSFRGVGSNWLTLPGNLTLTLSGKVSEAAKGTGSLVMTSAAGAGAGTLVLTNAANSYTGGTTVNDDGGGRPTLIIGDPHALGTGQLILGRANFEATSNATITVPVDLYSANVVLGGAAPDNGTMTFQGVPAQNVPAVSLAGVNRLDSTAVATLIKGSVTGGGSLSDTGSITLTGAANIQTGQTAASPGPLEIDGSQTSSPVPVTGTMLVGTGDVGLISAGDNGVVAPGTPGESGNFGVLRSNAGGGGANFSDNGTLLLRVQNNTGAGIDYDRLDLGGNPLVVGGTSRLVLDLSGLSGLTNILPVSGVVLYGSRIGNIPVFNEVDVINNPNNYAVELDYQQNELDLQIALGAVDAPVLTVPGAQGTLEDIPLVLSSGNNNLLSVGDVGAVAPLVVTLSVTHGTLTLGSTAGLFGPPNAPPGVNGNGTSTVSFSGAVSDINTALAGLTYTPNDDYVGSDTLTLSVTNLGGNGLLPIGGTQTTTATVALTVTKTADAPTFTVPQNEQSLTANDNSGLQTYLGWATNIQGEPPNQSNLTGLSFSTTSDNKGIFAASGQPQVDTSGNLTFTPQVNTGGVAHVTVTLSNGSDLDGDTDTSSLTFTITVNNTNAPNVSNIIIHWGRQSATLASALPAGRKDVPFQGINAIDLVFNQKVSVDAGGFSVAGLTGAYTVSGPTLVGTNTLEWKLTTALAAATGYDNISLGLKSSAVHAANGLAFGGSISNGNFKVLVGDVNGDGVVDLNDQLAVLRSLAVRYVGLSFFDIDGNGSIDMNDYYIVRNNTGHKIH